MRLFRVLPDLSLLGAFTSPLGLREAATYTLDARALDDMCANINTRTLHPPDRDTASCWENR